MEQENIDLAAEIIFKYSQINSKLIDESAVLFERLSTLNFDNINNNNIKLGIRYADTLNDILSIDAIAKQKNKEVSSDFNMLRLFNIGETQHSYLLAYFLTPSEAHGQGHLFLNAFLDKLKITRYHDRENWMVTAEKGRIDVLLKRAHPHAVVVIENKSNYAVDQNHQLYRYWYQEIYRTICDRHLDSQYIFNPPSEQYQLIYLSPGHWKAPNANTLTKPEGWGQDLPPSVPIEAKHLLFSDFVCNWLGEVLNELPVSNHRLREYVKQYIEYWS